MPCDTQFKVYRKGSQQIRLTFHSNPFPPRCPSPLTSLGMEYIIRGGGEGSLAEQWCLVHARSAWIPAPDHDAIPTSRPSFFPGIRSHASQITAKRGNYAFYAAAYCF